MKPSGEPQRHGDTKSNPQRMDRHPTFVPLCLCGESSGLSRRRSDNEETGMIPAAGATQPNPIHFTGGNGGRGANEPGSSETIHSPRIDEPQRHGDTKSNPQRMDRHPAFVPLCLCGESSGWMSLANQSDGRDGPLGRPFCSARPAVAPYRRRQADSDAIVEPQRHGDTKSDPRRMDRHPTFVPLCLCGESSGLNGAPSLLCQGSGGLAKPDLPAKASATAGGRALPCLNLSPPNLPDQLTP
jgi:hypothetical protein